MSIPLLTIVVVGFTPTLYLRSYIYPHLPSYFDPGGIVQPMHLYVRGIVLTAWFLVAVVQPSLVVTRRTALHKRLGVAGVVLTIAVVAVGVLTVVLRDAPIIDEVPRRGAANLIPLSGFAIRVAAAVMLRHRPASHKRLMLWASLSLLAPALDRIGRLPPLYELGVSAGWFPTAPQLVFTIVANLSLLIVVVAYDLVSEKRVHRATILGICAHYPIAYAISAALAFSGLWTAFVRAFT